MVTSQCQLGLLVVGISVFGSSRANDAVDVIPLGGAGNLLTEGASFKNRRDAWREAAGDKHSGVDQNGRAGRAA